MNWFFPENNFQTYPQNCGQHTIMEVVPENNFYPYYQNSAPQTKMEVIPGGVSYTFTSSIATPPPNEMRSFQHVQPQVNTDKCSLTIQQQVAIKQLELQQLQNVLLQEQLSTGYVIFHNDKKLSTSDIPTLNQNPPESISSTSSSDFVDKIPEKATEKTDIGTQALIKKKSAKSSSHEKNDKPRKM